MISIKNVVLVITAIITAQICFAQTDYREGFIINSANDTVFGQVNYKVSRAAHEICRFKSSNDEQSMTYAPEDIKGYGFINDKFFLSRVISTEDQSQKSAFFEVLVKGLANLYKLDKVYYIEKEDSGLRELVIETREVMVNGTRTQIKTNRHLATLNMLLSDCVRQQEIQGIRLNERMLTNLVEGYNHCKGAATQTFKSEKPWTRVNMAITGGINISQLHFSHPPSWYKHLNGEFKTDNSVIIGTGADVVAPRVNERISFHADLMFLKTTYYNHVTYISPEVYVTIEDINYVTIQVQQLKMPLGIRYTFPGRNFQPYFTVGLSATFHLDVNSNWIREISTDGVIETFENEALLSKGSQSGLWGSIGALKHINKKMSGFIEFRYEQSSGFSHPRSGLFSDIENFQILTGVKLR